MEVSCGELLDRTDQVEQQFEAFCGEVRDTSPDNICRLVAYSLSRGCRRIRTILETIPAESREEIRSCKLSPPPITDLSVGTDLFQVPSDEVAPGPFLAALDVHLTDLIVVVQDAAQRVEGEAARKLFKDLAEAGSRELKRVKRMADVPDFSKGKEKAVTMDAFELSLPAEDDPLDLENQGVRGALLLENARWFVKLRWLVMVILAAVGCVMLAAPDVIRRLGLPPAGGWLLGLAGSLCLTNLAFFWHVRRLGEGSTRKRIAANTWVQIISDLIIVTILVHVIGSTGSFVSFMYLFHIVLACIFFHPRKSLLLTVTATALYWICILLEYYGVLRPPNGAGPLDSPAKLFIALGTVGVWAGVWYLTSSLSDAVRRRDRLLDKANRELQRASEEKNRLVLIAAHDLKAPLAGACNNINVLKMLHWEETPEAVRGIIDRIEVRAETLARRIKDTLALGNLRSPDSGPPEMQSLAFGTVVGDVLEGLQSRADSRSVEIICSGDETKLWGNEEQVRLLLDNLVSNAISYSHEGGTVRVTAKQESGTGGAAVFVADRGIGIPKEAMDHIFEEYFRTKEANRFNRMSTGLGLAIVRQIARNLDLRVYVKSKQGHGTTFEIHFPKPDH